MHVRRQKKRPTPNAPSRILCCAHTSTTRSRVEVFTGICNLGYRHKCAVCGRTDVTNPELQFRYCSKCAGYHCFCSDHIFNHVHFTDENP